MLEVECHDASEIRMGSPYKVCRLRFSGEWIPDLPATDWQDVFAWSEGLQKLALVHWDVPGNRPGFKLVIVEPAARTVAWSPRFDGCCSELAWKDQKVIAWRAFPDLEGEFSIE